MGTDRPRTAAARWLGRRPHGPPRARATPGPLRREMIRRVALGHHDAGHQSRPRPGAAALPTTDRPETAPARCPTSRPAVFLRWWDLWCDCSFLLSRVGGHDQRNRDPARRLAELLLPAREDDLLAQHAQHLDREGFVDDQIQPTLVAGAAYLGGLLVQRRGSPAARPAIPQRRAWHSHAGLSSANVVPILLLASSSGLPMRTRSCGFACTSARIVQVVQRSHGAARCARRRPVRQRQVRVRWTAVGHRVLLLSRGRRFQSVP